jgi:hypothetical protein
VKRCGSFVFIFRMGSIAWTRSIKRVQAMKDSDARVTGGKKALKQPADR